MASPPDIFTPPPMSAPDERAGSMPGTNGTHGYWRKLDGWICVRGMGAAEMRAGVTVGRAPLMQYGEFDTANGRGGWDTTRDPYRQILERGGIGEFPLSQILELNWHRRPHPILAARCQELVRLRSLTAEEALAEVIPQLRGFHREDFPCVMCPGRQPFNGEADLLRHEIMHQEDVRQRQLGRSIQDAILAAQAGNTAALVPLLQQFAQSSQAVQETLAALLLERQNAPVQAEIAAAEGPRPARPSKE